MTATPEQKRPKAVIEEGANGRNVTLLKTIDRLRTPIHRSRAWVAARLVEDSPIYQDALSVADENIETLALQLCIVREQKVDKVVRDSGVFKLSELDPMSDIRSVHDRMVARVR